MMLFRTRRTLEDRIEHLAERLEAVRIAYRGAQQIIAQQARDKEQLRQLLAEAHRDTRTLQERVTELVQENARLRDQNAALERAVQRQADQLDAVAGMPTSAEAGVAA